ncbi:hypothetical protein [Microbacterium aoyamense]|nr:hypothetical protein [Microbacterium aoyamense]
MNPLLLSVVHTAHTVDSLELALDAAHKALDDAIAAAIAGGVTVAEIEEASGVEVTRPDRA